QGAVEERTIVAFAALDAQPGDAVEARAVGGARRRARRVVARAQVDDDHRLARRRRGGRGTCAERDAQRRPYGSAWRYLPGAHVSLARSPSNCRPMPPASPQRTVAGVSTDSWLAALLGRRNAIRTREPIGSLRSAMYAPPRARLTTRHAS